MSTNSMITIALVLFLVMFAPRFVKVVPAGHVAVAELFGNVDLKPVQPGFHIVNPMLRWTEFDVRENTHKESAQIPTRDQLQTQVEVSVQWRVNPEMAAQMYMKVGTRNQAIEVYLVPKVRSLVREQGTTIAKAEDFFLEETRTRLEDTLMVGLSEYLTPLGINVQAVLIRDINLPPVLTKAIEQKKEREQAVERQKAELERYRTEQLQQVAKADAERQAAEQMAAQIRILAEAKADEIRLINDAIAKNPAYIKLQSLEALKSMSKDPAAKLYFMDSNAVQPLPLMHIGDARAN
jgi:regulator of protease activity HflC (stomatin/prohibitin superfamily)